MSRRRTHEHDCSTCGKPFECCGTLEQNYDGWPEVICRCYHVAYYTTCAECQERDAQPENMNEHDD